MSTLNPSSEVVLVASIAGQLLQKPIVRNECPSEEEIRLAALVAYRLVREVKALCDNPLSVEELDSQLNRLAAQTPSAEVISGI